MFIKSFEIRNFKSIENSGEILFNNLMIFIGPNNSGKTNLHQALLLMKQTFENKDPLMPLTLNGPLVSLGEFKLMIFKGDLTKTFEIKFNFIENVCYKCLKCGDFFSDSDYVEVHLLNKHGIVKDKENFYKYEYQEKKIDNSSLRYSYYYEQDKKLIKIKEIEYKFENYKHLTNYLTFNFEKNEIYTKLNSNIGKFRAEGYINRSKIYQLPDHRNIFPQFEALNRVFSESFPRKLLVENNGKINFEIFNPDNPKETIRFKIHIDLNEYNSEYQHKSEEISLFSFYDIIRDNIIRNFRYLEDVLKDSRYLGPLREVPKRINIAIGGNPKSVGIGGEYTYEIIWRDHGKKQKLEKILNNWLKKNSFNCTLKVINLGSSNIFQVKVDENGLILNISDMGFGLSQVLPVLVECLLMSKEFHKSPILDNESRTCRFFLINKRFLIIEEPEIHLNPKIQAELGDFFIETCNESTPFIIETHSVHIINRIQRRIMEKKFNHENLVIYFFQKEKNKTKITPISIEKIGNFSFWPKGFFQDDYYDTVEMLKASMENKKEN